MFQVARYCPAQFLQYHKCLGEGDATRCSKEQEALSSCVQTKYVSFALLAHLILTLHRVPSFIKILSECQTVMKNYENCIKENIKIRSKCFEELRAVRECSAKAINAKENLD